MSNFLSGKRKKKKIIEPPKQSEIPETPETPETLSPTISPELKQLLEETEGADDSLHEPDFDYEPPSSETEPAEPVVQPVTRDFLLKELIVYPTKAHIGDRVLMVTLPGATTQPMEAYLVPRSSVNFDVKGKQLIKIDSTVESVYDWTQTVDALLPDRETMVRNVVLSFLRAGVLSPDADLNSRRQAFRTAFPYTLEDRN